jgi:transcriptional regulator with XRE-family HTH domain
MEAIAMLSPTAIRLRRTRDAAGMRLRYAARIAGLHPRELEDAERGARQLGPDALAALARLYGTTAEYLETGLVTAFADRLDSER